MRIRNLLLLEAPQPLIAVVLSLCAAVTLAGGYWLTPPILSLWAWQVQVALVLGDAESLQRGVTAPRQAGHPVAPRA